MECLWFVHTDDMGIESNRRNDMPVTHTMTLTVVEIGQRTLLLPVKPFFCGRNIPDSVFSPSRPNPAAALSSVCVSGTNANSVDTILAVSVFFFGCKEPIFPTTISQSNSKLGKQGRYLYRDGNHGQDQQTTSHERELQYLQPNWCDKDGSFIRLKEHEWRFVFSCEQKRAGRNRVCPSTPLVGEASHEGSFLWSSQGHACYPIFQHSIRHQEWREQDWEMHNEKDEEREREREREERATDGTQRILRAIVSRHHRPKFESSSHMDNTITRIEG